MRTGQIDPRDAGLDSWSVAEMITAMYEGQLAAAGAVRDALGAITAAVEDAVPVLRRGGRIVYVGAGTSARVPPRPPVGVRLGGCRGRRITVRLLPGMAE